MAVPLGLAFPAHRAASPPSSAGFYRFPKGSRSLPETLMHSRDNISKEFPSPPLSPLKLLRTSTAQTSPRRRRSPKIKTPSRRNFKYTHSLELIDNEINLLASFSNHSCYLGVDNRKQMETQTEEFVLKKKSFEDLKGYRAWCTEKVDPFIKVLL